MQETKTMHWFRNLDEDDRNDLIQIMYTSVHVCAGFNRDTIEKVKQTFSKTLELNTDQICELHKYLYEKKDPIGNTQECKNHFEKITETNKKREIYKVQQKEKVMDLGYVTLKATNVVNKIIDSAEKKRKRTYSNSVASGNSLLQTWNTNSVDDNAYQGFNRLHQGNKENYVDHHITMEEKFRQISEELRKEKKKEKNTNIIQKNSNPLKEKATKLYDLIKTQVHMLQNFKCPSTTEVSNKTEEETKITIKQHMAKIENYMEFLEKLDHTMWSKLIQEIQWRQLKKKFIIHYTLN
jgi:hypothetical protein